MFSNSSLNSELGNETIAGMKFCDENEEVKSYKTIDSVFTFINVMLPIMAGIALISNATFVTVAIYGIRRGRLPLKRYALPIGRSLGDILTILISCGYYLKENYTECDKHMCDPTTNGWFSQTMQGTFILNYWSVSLSYTGIASLTYYAVMSPLKYKVDLTASIVIKTMISAWLTLLTILFMTVYLIHDGELNYNSNSVIHLFFDDFSEDEYMGEWIVDLCVLILIDKHPPLRSAMVTMIPPLIFYFISLFCYLLIIKELFYKRSSNIYKRHCAAMWRLGSHLLLFSGTCFLTGTAYYGSIPMTQFCKDQEILYRQRPLIVPPKKNICLDPVVLYTGFTAAAALGWFTRMAVDGFIDTFVDGVLRRAVTLSVRPNASTFSLTTAENRHTTEVRCQPHMKLCSIFCNLFTSMSESNA